MEWLNYHHLLYFWTVAREGSIARAAEKLSLAQPTISNQLRTLERNLGHQLFTADALARLSFGANAILLAPPTAKLHRPVVTYARVTVVTRVFLTCFHVILHSSYP